MSWFRRLKSEEGSFDEKQNTRDEFLDQINNIVGNNIGNLKEKFNDLLKNGMKEAFAEFTELTDDIKSLSGKVKYLKEQKEKLEDDNRKAKKDLELQELELKHLAKLKEERDKLAIERKEVELEKKYNEKKLELMQDNFKNLEKTIEKYNGNTTELYKAIMKVLPNVNVEVLKEK